MATCGNSGGPFLVSLCQLDRCALNGLAAHLAALAVRLIAASSAAAGRGMMDKHPNGKERVEDNAKAKGNRRRGGQLRRQGHHRPRGPRGGSQAPRHVHRLDRPARPPPPRLRGRRQLRRRGARRPLRPASRSTLHPDNSGHRRRRRPRHPGRAMHEKEKRPAAEVVLTRPARRRQVRRRRRLQGLRRPARRRRLGRQRALRAPSPRDPAATATSGPRTTSAASRRTDLTKGEKTDEHGDDDHLPPRRRDLRGRRASTTQTLAERLRETAFLTRGLRIDADRRARRGPAARPSSTRAASSTSSRHLNENKDALHRKTIYFEGETDDGAGRGRDAVELLLPGVDLQLRQQHQHPRGRLAPLRLPLGADPDPERLRAREGAAEGEGREPDAATTSARA